MARGTCGDKVAQNVKNTLTDWEIVTLRREGGREGRKGVRFRGATGE